MFEHDSEGRLILPAAAPYQEFAYDERLNQAAYAAAKEFVDKHPRHRAEEVVVALADAFVAGRGYEPEERT